MKLIDSIKIQGGLPVLGEVKLSGDPISAILLMAKAAFSKHKVVVQNVPRSRLVLDFIDVLSAINIKVDWISEDEVAVYVRESIQTNISYLYEGDKLNFAYLLIPVILRNESKCCINNELSDEVKFYKKIGFIVAKKQEVIEIALPSSNLLLDSIEAEEMSIYKIAARVLLQNLFDIKVVNSSVDKRISLIDVPGDIVTARATYNQHEFNLYASLGVLTNGEIRIRNFDLSESLSFLLSIEKFGGVYEVIGDVVKVWYSGNCVHGGYFDLSKVEVDVLGYCIGVYSVYSISCNIKQTAQILTILNEEVSELVKTFNILGFNIDLVDSKTHMLLDVDPLKSFSQIKLPLPDTSWAGVLIALMAAIPGKHKLTDVSAFFHSIPHLYDNLGLVKVNVSRTG